MKITNPTEIVNLLNGLQTKKRENFGVICLDSAHNLITKKVLYVGTCNRSLVSTREILYYALKKDSCAIIVFHNHPSGDTYPSEVDVKTTKALKDACDVIGIQLLDHVIVGKWNYYSFLENNLVIKSSEEKLCKVSE